VNGKQSGLAQSVQARLLRHAKEIGADPNLVLARYGIERFLYRLSRSRHAEQFVLKGALLLLVWLCETLRPTRDADLLGFGELSDEALAGIFKEVCGVEVDPDGVTFDPDSVTVAAIREEDAYGGRRVMLQGRLGAARLTVQVDIGIGDAVTPAPQWLEYPSLLDLPPPRLRAYPRETVVAEKVHAMVLFGTRNSRMKDYFDVHALLREEKLDANELVRALSATFERRRTALPEGPPAGLSDAFTDDAAKQSQWRAFLNKNRLKGPELDAVVAEIREALTEPLARARRGGEA
jgi:predicted nucleotidyltransferase component of viral defense system